MLGTKDVGATAVVLQDFSAFTSNRFFFVPTAKGKNKKMYVPKEKRSSRRRSGCGFSGLTISETCRMKKERKKEISTGGCRVWGSCGERTEMTTFLAN